MGCAAASAAAVVLMAAGCTVGPDYAAPQTKVADSWSSPLEGGLSGRSADISAWWTALQDPTLDGLIRRAVAQNNDLKRAGARVREARALLGSAESDNFPTLDASGRFARQRTSSNTGTVSFPGQGRPTNLWSAGFDAAWEMDIFGRIRRSVESAQAEVEAAELGRSDVLVTLTAETGRNYVLLRGQQRRLEIARQNLAAQLDTLKLTNSRFGAGLTSELDVARAKTNVETTRSQIPALEQAVKQTIFRLSVLLGQQPGTLVAELGTVGPIPAIPAELAVGAPSELLRRRPDIRRAERELAAATAKIGVATADLFPRLTLNGSVSLQASKFATTFDSLSTAYGFGPNLTWRAFDGGRIRASINAAGARAEQSLAAYDQAVIVALEEAEGSIVAYAREQERRVSLRDAVAAGERTVELARSQYERGLTDFQNVLDAQRNLFALQDTLVQSETTVTSNLIAVFKALGGGWPVDAATPVAGTAASAEAGTQPTTPATP